MIRISAYANHRGLGPQRSARPMSARNHNALYTERAHAIKRTVEGVLDTGLSLKDSHYNLSESPDKIILKGLKVDAERKPVTAEQLKPSGTKAALNVVRGLVGLPALELPHNLLDATIILDSAGKAKSMKFSHSYSVGSHRLLSGSFSREGQRDYYVHDAEATFFKGDILPVSSGYESATYQGGALVSYLSEDGKEFQRFSDK